MRKPAAAAAITVSLLECIANAASAAALSALKASSSAAAPTSAAAAAAALVGESAAASAVALSSLERVAHASAATAATVSAEAAPAATAAAKGATTTAAILTLLLGVLAGLASDRLVIKSLRGIELFLASREDEVGPAVFADQLLVSFFPLRSIVILLLHGHSLLFFCGFFIAL
jgi:hypothetical protein